MGKGRGRTLYRAACVVALATVAVLPAASCSDSSESADDASASSASLPPSTSDTTTSTPPVDGEACGRAPEVDPDRADADVLDEASLRGTPAEVRLPEGAGFPWAVVALADGAVILEEDAEIDSTPGAGEGLRYARAELLLRRLDGDGATVWTRRLGPAADPDLSDRDTVLVLDGDLIRVLWLRYDGPFPVALSNAVPATVVLSGVGLDGTVESEVELVDLPGGEAASADAGIVLALGADGTAAAGQVRGQDLVVSSYAPTGASRWQDRIPAPSDEAKPHLAVLADSQVVAASGGQVVRWDDGGRQRWALPLEPTSLAPVAPISSTGGAPTDVLLSFDEGDDGWFCALDADGRVTVQVSETRLFLGEVDRAWSTESGLMVLATFVGLGATTDLITFDADGNVVGDVVVAGAGDVFPAPGSVVHDGATTDQGDLLLVAAITDNLPGGGATSTDLESWNALIRLPAPAGAGDLSELPVSDPPAPSSGP